MGSHTIPALQKLGYEVFNLDLKTGWDIRKIEDLRKVIEQGDKVLHLAAISRFKDADDDPYNAYMTNVLGCGNVASVCQEKRAERLVYSSTGSVYMPVEQEPPITENFKVRGNSVYACSKHWGELVIQKIGFPHIILRYAHLYGEGRLMHGAIGAFLTRVERGLAPTLYGGKQSNDFTYIADVVQANILALQTAPVNLNNIFNIGTGEEITTEKVFEILKKYTGYKGEIEKMPYRSVDPMRFVYDILKARDVLGYRPEYNFEKGIKEYLGK